MCNLSLLILNHSKAPYLFVCLMVVIDIYASGLCHSIKFWLAHDILVDVIVVLSFPLILQDMRKTFPSNLSHDNTSSERNI